MEEAIVLKKIKNNTIVINKLVAKTLSFQMKKKVKTKEETINEENEIKELLFDYKFQISKLRNQFHNVEKEKHYFSNISAEKGLIMREEFWCIK